MYLVLLVITGYTYIQLMQLIFSQLFKASGYTITLIKLAVFSKMYINHNVPDETLPWVGLMSNCFDHLLQVVTVAEASVVY